MSKKIFIILIAGGIALLLLILVIYYFIAGKSNNTNTTQPSVFKSFFPFGGSTPPEPVQPIVEPVQPTNPQTENYAKKLRKLSAEPVAGSGVQDIKTGTVVRYIEKATGHIFELDLFSPRKDRISNTTIPLAYDAVWGNNNNSLIARYLKDDNQTIDTYSLNIKAVSTTTENTISGITFPSHINDVSVLGNSVFYIIQNRTGSVGYISNIDGSKKRQIWNSPIREVLGQFVNGTTVSLTTKPAPNIPGFMYTVNISNGQTKKILGNIVGLTTLMSPDGTKILYMSSGNGVGASVYDTVSKKYTNITPITFPEKCVWSKKIKTIVYCAVPRESITPDSLTSWYMGLSQFTDDIWQYDTKTNTSKIVESLYDDSGEVIDVIKPILSDGEQYLVFINKRDGSLWSLDLSK